jgi:hypothetical protein
MVLDHYLHMKTICYTPPTVSHGLIVYALDSQKWILVQRKHSAEFMVFIKGYYRLVHLPLLVRKFMPSEVAHIVEALKEIEYFNDLYTEVLCLPPKGLSYGRLRFSEVLKIIPSLLTMVAVDNTLTWSWPKGRPLYGTVKEDSLVTAKREFVEEVEIMLPPSLFQSNECIMHEQLTTTGKIINSYYWFYAVEKEFVLPPVTEHTEVQDRAWYTVDDSLLIMPEEVIRQAFALVAVNLDF